MPISRALAVRRWRRRTQLVAGAVAVVVGGVGLIGTEAALAFSGGGSPQPPGSADGHYGPATGSPIRFVVLGDSTGAAVGASSVDEGYPHRVATALVAAVGRPVELHVLAVSGARVADVLHDQLPKVAALHPDIVLVIVGGNDVVRLTNGDAAQRDLRAVINGTKALASRVIVSGVPAMGTVRRVAQPLRWLLGALGRGYDERWKAEATAAGVARIELAAHTEKPFSDDPGLLSGDGFHPSDRGYAVWAGVIAPVVVDQARGLP